MTLVARLVLLQLVEVAEAQDIFCSHSIPLEECPAACAFPCLFVDLHHTLRGIHASQHAIQFLLLRNGRNGTLKHLIRQG